MAERKIERMSAQEFYEWQSRQDRNYELVNGVPLLTPKAMTGASRRHDVITVNVLSLLRQKLRGKPCRPYTDDIAVPSRNGNIRRPDIIVDCGKGPDRSTEAVEPTVLIEVLSPSTTRFDRFQKIEEYKANDLIQVVLLVDSEAPRVIVWRRDEARQWTYNVIEGIGERIELPEIDAALALADVYEDVEFED